MNIDTYVYATAKISKWLTESILFSFMYGSNHWEALPNIVVLRICKNNNKLLISEAKSLKNICEGTTFSPSLVFRRDFNYIFFFPEHLSGPVKSRDLRGFDVKKIPSEKIKGTKMPLFFFRDLQLITVLLSICDSYSSRSTRFVSLNLCLGFSILDSVPFLLKFIFLFNKMHGPFDFKTA